MHTVQVAHIVDLDLCHRCLYYASKSVFIKSQSTVSVLPDISALNEYVLHQYRKVAKSTRRPCKALKQSMTRGVLKRVNNEVVEPIEATSFKVAKYFVTLVDEYTG